MGADEQAREEQSSREGGRRPRIAPEPEMVHVSCFESKVEEARTDLGRVSEVLKLLASASRGTGSDGARGRARRQVRGEDRRVRSEGFRVSRLLLVNEVECKRERCEW